MKVLILSSAFSGLTQRVQRELQLLGHEIEEHYDLYEPELREQLESFQPDLVLCPFLTQRIPEDVWKKYLCLVVHPGIEGDRGPSSLDWAISAGLDEWGVTLLQAEEAMDAGDIWGTQNFPMRIAGKTSIYKREVSTTAIQLIKQALKNIESNAFKPRPLVYGDGVSGRLRPLMRQGSRAIDWNNDTTEVIVNKLNAADTNPGVRAVLNGVEVHLYGAKAEYGLKGKPGDILAMYQGAFCCATRDGAVWIRQLKCKTHKSLAPIKLPATMVLKKICAPSQLSVAANTGDFSAIESIWFEREGDVAYLYFDFYNGAMNTAQCVKLRNCLITLKQSNVKYIVLMGGEDFWSNGIHLNCIEAADDPAREAWENINAIDDVVKEIIDTPDHVTIAALRNNAGAGGAIMALACDKVVVRDGVVLNPHYKSMGLYGSEYWTYLLPKRIGEESARKVTEECKPMLASEAVDMGMADCMLGEDWDTYHEQLKAYCSQLSETLGFADFLVEKARQRQADEQQKPLEEYRAEELVEMQKTFSDASSEYHAARRAFVYKEKKEKKTAGQKAVLSV